MRVALLLVFSALVVNCISPIFADQPKSFPTVTHDSDPKLVIPGTTRTEPAPSTPDKSSPLPTRPKASAKIANDSLSACFGKSEIDQSQFTDKEKEIIHELTSNNKPKFSLVTDAWLEAYLSDYNKQKKTDLSFGFVKGLLQNVIASPPSNDPFIFKKYLEGRLEKDFHGRKLVYNREKTNPLDMLLEGKGQCASGSLCYSIAARYSWGSDIYESRNPVAILMKGHLLPGFVLQDPQGEKYLVGLESTVSGEGKVLFGKIKDLADYPAALRIIDADLYAILDLLGDRLPKSVFDCLLQGSVAKTGKKHGINYVSLEEKIAKQTPKNTLPQVSKDSGRGRLGFGEPSTPPGDLERSESDRLDGTRQNGHGPDERHSEPNGSENTIVQRVIPSSLVQQLDQLMDQRESLIKKAEPRVSDEQRFFFHGEGARQELGNWEDYVTSEFISALMENRQPKALPTLNASAFDRDELDHYLNQFVEAWQSPEIINLAKAHEATAKELFEFGTKTIRGDSARSSEQKAKGLESAMRFLPVSSSHKTPSEYANELMKDFQIEIQPKDKAELIRLATLMGKQSLELVEKRNDLYLKTRHAKEHALAAEKIPALAKQREGLIKQLAEELKHDEKGAADLLRNLELTELYHFKMYKVIPLPQKTEAPIRSYLENLHNLKKELDRTGPPGKWFYGNPKGQEFFPAPFI